MPDILDAYDAGMLAKSRMSKWQADFEANWNKPQTVMLRAEWKKLPEQAREMLRSQIDPDILKMLEVDDGDS